ncbi:MAG: hypothetical protein ACKV2Q_16090 [Planctomycetaceae bacterium]
MSCRRVRSGASFAIRSFVALTLLMTPWLSGCATQRALRQHTVSANITVADIYYQQVLNNIACFAANPAAMPSFAVVTAGTVNVEDQQGASFNPTYSPTLTRFSQGGGALPILSLLFGVSATRSVSENWSTAPVTDSDNIRRLRCAFQVIVGAGNAQCDQCQDRLKGFFVGATESYECMLPMGWYCVGGKNDVPKDACHVGRYGDTYAWVMPDGVDGLTRFTITVLDIATGETHAPQRSVVKTYKGEPKPENLETTEITSQELDEEALKDASKFLLDRERHETQNFNRGLFFVPR